MLYTHTQCVHTFALWTYFSWNFNQMLLKMVSSKCIVFDKNFKLIYKSKNIIIIIKQCSTKVLWHIGCVTQSSTHNYSWKYTIREWWCDEMWVIWALYIYIYIYINHLLVILPPSIFTKHCGPSSKHCLTSFSSNFRTASSKFIWDTNRLLNCLASETDLHMTVRVMECSCLIYTRVLVMVHLGTDFSKESSLVWFVCLNLRHSLVCPIYVSWSVAVMMKILFELLVWLFQCRPIKWNYL